MAKKWAIECPNCHRIMRTCVDVEDSSDADHLYLMSASACLTDIVKIGRSRSPTDRACQLQEGMPFHMIVHCIFHGMGNREKDVHTALAAFRVNNTPGTEWYKLSAHQAYNAIGNVLFDQV